MPRTNNFPLPKKNNPEKYSLTFLTDSHSRQRANYHIQKNLLNETKHGTWPNSGEYSIKHEFINNNYHSNHCSKNWYFLNRSRICILWYQLKFHRIYEALLCLIHKVQIANGGGYQPGFVWTQSIHKNLLQFREKNFTEKLDENILCDINI